MSKHLSRFKLLTLMLSIVIASVAFAEGPETTPKRSATSPFRHLSILEKSSMTLYLGIHGALERIPATLWNTNSILVSGLRDEIYREQFIYLYYPGSEPINGWIPFDSGIVDEFGNVHATRAVDTCYFVGLRFYFKQFRLQNLQRSISSFVKDFNKSAHGSAPSLSFWFDILDF